MPAEGMGTFGNFGTFGLGQTWAGYGDMDYGGGFGLCVATHGVVDTTGSSLMLEGEDGSRISLHSPEDGWTVKKVDTGAPVVRTVAQDKAGAHGTYDQTRWVGGRNVLIDLNLAGNNRQSMLDALAPYLKASARPSILIKTERTDAYRRLQVVPATLPSVPWERPGEINITLTYRSASSPFWTGLDARQANAFPIDDAPGRTYDRSYDRAYPSSAGTGPALLVNRGSEQAEWVARIFGPVTGPRLILAATGEQLAFKSTFHIENGDYITVDSSSGLVYAGDSPASGRRNQIDFAETDREWFKINPGTNLVRFTGATVAVPAQAEITFHDTYL